jgi:hypothetical protein
MSADLEIVVVAPATDCPHGEPRDSYDRELGTLTCGDCPGTMNADLARIEAKLDYVVGFISQLESAVKSNPMASKLFGV